MRRLVAALAAVSTLSLAFPALACGLDEGPARPIVAGPDQREFLSEAARLDAQALSTNEAAIAAEGRADELATAAASLRQEARFGDPFERDELRSRAQTLEARASALLGRARDLRARVSTLRARARALRDQARQSGSDWRRKNSGRNRAVGVI